MELDPEQIERLKKMFEDDQKNRAEDPMYHGFRDQADVLMKFKRAYEDAGFSPEQAFYLAGLFHQITWTQSLSRIR